MRELKFRAWLKHENWYVEIEKINFVKNYYSYEDKHFCTQHDIVLEQYAGLKDKNGIEICEGDIVDTYDDEYNSSKLKIEFREGNYVGVDNNVGYEEPISNHHYKGWEIIGNIHENADLINVIKGE